MNLQSLSDFTPNMYCNMLHVHTSKVTSSTIKANVLTEEGLSGAISGGGGGEAATSILFLIFLKFGYPPNSIIRHFSSDRKWAVNRE